MYEAYNAMPVSRLNAEIEKTLPDSILMGYGYYGAYTAILDGKYYVCIKTGSSCD